MNLIAPFLLCMLIVTNDCENSSPVGRWKIAHHGDFPRGSYERIPLMESEMDRILTFDRCSNFWVVQANDTVDYGKWKLNKRGTKLTLKYTLSSSRTLRSGSNQRTPFCFADSISIGEDLPGRVYSDEDGPQESTYYRLEE